MIHFNSEKRSKNWRGQEITFVVPGETVGTIVNDCDFNPSVGARCNNTNSEQVTCIFFDTDDLANYQQLKWHRCRCFRMLHQSGDPYVSVERTTNSSDQVKLRRTSLPFNELEQLSAPPPARNCKGGWFFKRLKRRQLRPVCKASFTRMYLSNITSDSKTVVSIDRSFVCETASGLNLTPVTNGTPFLNDFAIVTVTYSNLFPLVAKCLMCQMQLTPSTVSTYHKAISACNPLAKAKIETAAFLTDGGSSSPLQPLTNSLNCDATTEEQYA